MTCIPIKPPKRAAVARASALALTMGLAAACGGSSDQDVLDPTGGSPSAAPTPTQGAPTATTTPGTGSPPSSPPNDPDAGSTTPTCTPEQERNNNRASANPLDGSRCGATESKTDVDYLTFTLKPTTRNVSLNFSGRVSLRVEVEGAAAVVLTPNQPRPIPVVQGKPYFVSIRPVSDQSAPTEWQVDLIEKP